MWFKRSICEKHLKIETFSKFILGFLKRTDILGLLYHMATFRLSWQLLHPTLSQSLQVCCFMSRCFIHLHCLPQMVSSILLPWSQWTCSKLWCYLTSVLPKVLHIVETPQCFSLWPFFLLSFFDITPTSFTCLPHGSFSLKVEVPVNPIIDCFLSLRAAQVMSTLSVSSGPRIPAILLCPYYWLSLILFRYLMGILIVQRSRRKHHGNNYLWQVFKGNSESQIWNGSDSWKEWKKWSTSWNILIVWKCVQFILTSVIIILFDRGTDEAPTAPIYLTVKTVLKSNIILKTSLARK